MQTDITQRTDELIDRYAQDLDKWVNEIVPPILDNEEYTARCSALMIALNRQLARCAVSFGSVHNVSDLEMCKMVGAQFNKNYRLCADLVQGSGQLIQ